MTTYRGGRISEAIKRGKLRSIAFSGTVNLSGAGVVRNIQGCKTNFPGIIYSTVSDGSGNWSLAIPGGSNDEFRIICIGEADENSQIFEHLKG